MGSAQPALAEGSTPAGQTEPRSGYVISEQCPLRGVDAPSAGGSEDLEDLWQGRSRPFRLQRQLSLPNLLFEGQGRVGPRLAQPPPLCIPPDRPASTGRQACQGTGSQGAIGGPLVEEPTLVVRADSATDSSPLARAPETGSPLSGERNNMAPSTRAVGSLHLAAQREPTGLPERVLNTISEARAPSTRRLYALKWSVFSTWCLNRGENPSTSELAVVLSFLQELLDKGRSHSTLKVFVAAIAAFHAPIAGQSVGRDNSVVRFLKGARRLNPPRPLTVPTCSAHCTEGLERLAGWATPSTFARFYNLDIPALQARVLSAQMSLYTYAVGTILSEISWPQCAQALWLAPCILRLTEYTGVIWNDHPGRAWPLWV